MSIVTSIIDALRKFGSATQQSAVRRQDQQLEGKTVVERSRKVARSELGQAEGIVATIEPEPETITLLEESILEQIANNAALADGFAKAFLGRGLSNNVLDDLDSAFFAWAVAPDKRGFQSDDVIEIAGAAFGSFCVETLDMRWVHITGQFGEAIAIQGRFKDFRGYPYHSISKRIDAEEHGFFKPIYISLQNASKGDLKVPNAT